MEFSVAEDILIVDKQVKKKEIIDEKEYSNPLYDYVADEAGEELALYLEKWGFFRQPNVIFLSSIHHYFYNPEEIEKVQTIINLKQINQTKEVAYFLRTMNRILPLYGFYIGSFFDFKNQKEKTMNGNPSAIGYFSYLFHVFFNRFIPRIPVINRINYFLNQKKIKYWTASEIDHLLDSTGFKTLDIKEIGGRTFFIAEKVKQTRNENISFHSPVNYHRTKSRLID